MAGDMLGKFKQMLTTLTDIRVGTYLGRGRRSPGGSIGKSAPPIFLIVINDSRISIGYQFYADLGAIVSAVLVNYLTLSIDPLLVCY